MVPRGGIEPLTRGFSVQVTLCFYERKLKNYNEFIFTFSNFPLHPNLSRNCTRIISPELNPKFPTHGQKL